jgi:hypothetical protein
MGYKNKTRGFVFNFTPLSFAHGIAVINGVADKQNYNSLEHEYVPDYTLTPITLSPWVNMVDKDGVLTSGSVKAQLATIKWSVIVGGKETTITTGTDGYTIKSDGETRGDLVVGLNVAADTAVTYRFTATYLDTRTRQTHTIEDTYMLSCASASGSLPVLALGFNDAFVFNPVRCESAYTIRPTMHVGGEKVDDTTFLLQWQIKDTTTTAWRAISATDTGLSVSDDGKALTLTTAYFEGAATLRVRGVYDKDGAPSLDDLTEASPQKHFTITRRIPPFEVDLQAPTTIASNLEEVYTEVELYDNQGTFTAEAAGILLPQWYVAPDQSDGSPTLSTTLGYGYSMAIPTSYMNQQYGMVIGVEVLDVQPVAVATDSDGDYFTDSDGSVMLI